MSGTSPVPPSRVWDLAHPPQSKGLITTVLGLREATLEIRYFLTLRGGVSCACLEVMGFDLSDS